MLIIITSGYFDPLHVGHLDYLRRAKEIGGMHLCIVNNDAQAVLKKGKSFMPEDDRLQIVNSIDTVDEALLSVDSDSTVCETLRVLRQEYKYDTLIFAKGGDRDVGNIPETDVCRELGIYILSGLGGKVRSSSDFVKKAKEEPNE